MTFFGRKRELTQLKNLISSDGMLMSLIYGRRRIGKSELVKQAIKESGTKSIFYVCKQITEESNVQSLCEVLSDSLGLPQLGYTKV
nr:ATP-binding protein [Lachnospiraceae bacterium]